MLIVISIIGGFLIGVISVGIAWARWIIKATSW